MIALEALRNEYRKVGLLSPDEYREKLHRLYERGFITYDELRENLDELDKEVATG